VNRYKEKVAKVSDFKPLVKEDATAEERALLGAARAYEPAPTLRQGVLKRLGVSGIVVTFALVLSKLGLRSLLTGTSKFWSVTLLGVGAMSAVSFRAYQVSELKQKAVETTHVPEIAAAYSGSSAATSSVVETLAPTPEAVASAVPSAEPAKALPTEPTSSARVRADTTRSTPSSPMATVAGATLQDESTYLGEARELINQGKVKKGKDMLLHFRERFPSGRLEAEATVLLIEAQAKSKERDAARRLGAAFLERSPNHVLAAKVRSILQSLEADDGVH
jgi:hypothetical protein